MALGLSSSERPAPRHARLNACCQVLAKMLAVGLLVGGQLSTSGSADAARLAVVDYHARNDPNQLMFTPICNLKLSGEIMGGDYERARKIFAEFMRFPEVAAFVAPEVRQIRKLALCLSSPGGDLEESLKLSKLFSSMMMVIEDGEQCLSACAMIFLRGHRRDTPTEYAPLASGRYLHHRGKLGIHAPALRYDTAAPTLSRSDAAEAYARALRSMQAVLFHDTQEIARRKPFGPAPAQTGSALFRGQVIPDMPMDLVWAFLTVPPQDMLFVSTIDEALRWGIEIHGLPRPRAITQRMLGVACFNILNVRCEVGTYSEPCDILIPGASYDPSGKGGGSTWDLTWYNNLVAGFRHFRQDLIVHDSPAGRLNQKSYRMVDRDLSEYSCTIKATWLGEHLMRLDGEVTDRHPDDPRLPIPAPKDFEVRELIQGYRAEGLSVSDRHLPLWKMLPGPTRISEIASQGWSWLDEGEPAFDKPLLGMRK